MPENGNNRTVARQELDDLRARALPRIKDHLERSPLDPEDELPIAGKSRVVVT